ncbi:MAG: V-type ATP synthase subunit D [Candidatus Raymondbacteria bacterium RifOxyA12_full_50_37]|nr:MAG: V-type ATP synthase subunit D [Candidatus Raymondbacteria bacterium RifOxyA12_full_50_37]OGJ92624.1 MAG: V-type ATP synthase subunit D [Candidatus Raymondbacteria bacterium RIFOXYA2_FULL_49_16]OGJ97978.1 MAG: V-type ATP synthase subunit D [Candidatus Raymondbacteria bacterium RIFOXYC2_FULL_50_21]OGJ98631.1 MAG: V-type ATP synthase subunit D [Candidatus Raymondbacteria bacterium RifOxyC12_full_50_8]OGK00119.1 MAG: V-type ATP synthase subunit D [Candidatus Raymondbacteria bacterium RifOxy
MALKFQYNKTFLHQLGKELRVRENALPTLQAKESALRFEVKKAKQEVRELEAEYAKRNAAIEATYRLWGEFPKNLVTVEKVHMGVRKVAGVKAPVLEGVSFTIEPYSMVSMPSWVPAGVTIIKELAVLVIKREIAEKKMLLLEYTRRKTTQKVNLYEKVQIPAYRESIRKIKRYLEDDENLAKSSQKILKVRIAEAEAAA